MAEQPGKVKRVHAGEASRRIHAKTMTRVRVPVLGTQVELPSKAALVVTALVVGAAFPPLELIELGPALGIVLAHWYADRKNTTDADRALAELVREASEA